jgi:hypothetical protein
MTCIAELSCAAPFLRTGINLPFTTISALKTTAIR